MFWTEVWSSSMLVVLSGAEEGLVRFRRVDLIVVRGMGEGEIWFWWLGGECGEDAAVDGAATDGLDLSSPRRSSSDELSESAPSSCCPNS